MAESRRKGPRHKRPNYVNQWLILRALSGGPMTTPELLKATGVIEPSLYVSLRRLVSIGYVVKENTTYRITPEGEEALRRRAEGERVLREEVMPELRKAIDLGFSTEYVVEKIKRKVLKAMGKVRWL